MPAPRESIAGSQEQPHPARPGADSAARALAWLVASLLCSACSRAPSEELPTAEPNASSQQVVTPTAADPAPPAPSDPPPALDPASIRRAECERVTASVNGGARALADVEQRRERAKPDEYLDLVSQELERLATSLEHEQLETKELADFARDYARHNRRAAKVAREASSAATRGHADKLAGAESAMMAAMHEAQPLLERTARFCGKATR